MSRIVGLLAIENQLGGEDLEARNSRVRFCGSLWAYTTVLVWTPGQK